MASDTSENANSFAVMRITAGDMSTARLVWADGSFFTIFDRAGVGAPVFPDGAPMAVAAAVAGLADGAERVLGPVRATLFGRQVELPLTIAALGAGLYALSVAAGGEVDPDAEDARLAEILDALPVAVTIVEAVDGTILWMNGGFRDLVGGGEFDLMGTTLAGHFALPGAFKTLMGATGPVTPSAPLPTALRTLSGMMTPVVANAKRIAFRRRRAAMVALTRGL